MLQRQGRKRRHPFPHITLEFSHSEKKVAKKVEKCLKKMLVRSSIVDPSDCNLSFFPTYIIPQDLITLNPVPRGSLH